MFSPQVFQEWEAPWRHQKLFSSTTVQNRKGQSSGGAGGLGETESFVLHGGPQVLRQDPSAPLHGILVSRIPRVRCGGFHRWGGKKKKKETNKQTKTCLRVLRKNRGRVRDRYVKWRWIGKTCLRFLVLMSTLLDAVPGNIGAAFMLAGSTAGL